ncbi:MAG: TolC family protein [Bdellovibrionota bacterium]
MPTLHLLTNTRIALATGFFLMLSSLIANADVLTLESYLKQVRSKHSGYRAASEASTGAALRSEEGSLLLAPTLFGNVQRSSDERQTLNPLFQGNTTKIANYSLGVSKLTTFGLQARLFYETIHTEVIGASPAFITEPRFYDTRPVLELSQSLWRNFFGAETRITQERLEAQALATSYNESFRAKQILSRAETAYWRLVQARDVVKVQTESVSRARAMREWAARQARMQLADRSDLLQAEAALKVKELDLRAAHDEHRLASQDFNSVRGIEKDEVDDTLASLSAVQPVDTGAPERTEMRDDVRAANELRRATAASAEIGLQRASPTLEVYTTLSLNGRDQRFSSSSSEAFSTKHPWTIVGLRFSAPLDLGTTFATRAGYVRERDAADLDFERRRFEQDEEWRNLNRRLQEAKERLKLAQSIEDAQKEKLDNERSRHRRGRTTTYQVILFEQDYATAQISRIRNQGEILQLIAQMKTFGSLL